MNQYRACGVRLRTPLEFPGFRGDGGSGAEAFSVTLDRAPPEPSGPLVRARDEGEPGDAVEVRRPSLASLHLDFGDKTRFVVDVEAQSIGGAWPPPLTLDDALVYLVGPVLGATLRLLRRSVLHASAVEVDGRALLVMGDAGAGKSTLTAALVDAGLPLITEDVAALDVVDGAPIRVFRGGTRVKLWPESVRGLRGRDDALPLLVPSSVDWHKRYLDCAERMTAHDAVPVAAIVHLERTPDVDAPELTPLRAHDKLLCLLGNGYASRLVRPDDRADELSRVSRVAQEVPVLRMRYPDRFEALPGVVDTLRRLVEKREPGGGGGG
jgi:hypothetical protein